MKMSNKSYIHINFKLPVMFAPSSGFLFNGASEYWIHADDQVKSFLIMLSEFGGS